MDNVFKGIGRVIREVEYFSGITTLATEPVCGFLAVGTSAGKIALFGSGSVSIVVKLPKPAPVRLLQFAALVFKLVCVDQNGYIHVWDLSQLGAPKLQATELFRDTIQCIALSPCHSHVFMALQSGSIATYDLLCLNRSPYTIPRVWKRHEDHILASDMPIPPIPGSSLPMDIMVHPRDQNILFLAFAGGVALFDLTLRSVIRNYDLVLPPGAPGGIGYDDPELLQHRRRSLVSLSIHPCGHLFAAGYIDGCIAFWAVDDEDKPLLVRTLEELNVNIADAQKLSEVLDKGANHPSRRGPGQSREPIFKLSWSGFGSVSEAYGATTLTVLGGLMADDPYGVSVLLLPAFTPPVPTTPATRQNLHPEVRYSLVQYLEKTEAYFYDTPGPSQDYLLIPRNSPHLNSCHDPTAIVMLSQLANKQRDVQAREFPPPEWVSRINGSVSDERTSEEPDADKSSEDTLDDTLSATLQEMQLCKDPETIPLPTALWTGASAVLDGDLVRVSEDTYDSTIRDGEAYKSPSACRGGSAWVNYGDNDQSQDVQWTKRQSRRFLVTHHADRTVHFQDISPQLLIGSMEEPLQTSFPAPLSSLTINVPVLLSDIAVASHHQSIHPEQCEIQSVQLTAETAECVVTLRSGHVFVCMYSEKRRAVSSPVHADDEELVSLRHFPANGGCFHPSIFVNNAWGTVSACEMSNIGFLAIAYSSGALLIVDMRRPRTILRDGTDAKSQRQHSSFPLHLHSDDHAIEIASMKWLVCGYDHDATPHVRLLASMRSGDTRVFTISRSAGDWMAREEPKQLDGADQPLPRGNFVLNGKTGGSCVASRELLASASTVPANERSPPAGKDEIHCFWLSAGVKGVKCIANFTGSRVGKVDWGKGRSVDCVEVITRSGAQALVAITTSREVLVYSVPALEPLHVFRLQANVDSAISLDDTGDYVDWTFDMRLGTVRKATLGTLFAIRRVYDEPVVDLTAGRRAVPPQPQPVPLGPTSLLGSWFNFSKSISGDQVDALLAGPDRPLPEETSAIVSSQWQSQLQNRAQVLASQGSRMGTDIYNNLTSAVAERGEVLSSLEDSFRSLGEGGRNMMLQAKRLAAEQTGKRWLGL